MGAARVQRAVERPGRRRAGHLDGATMRGIGGGVREARLTTLRLRSTYLSGTRVLFFTRAMSQATTGTVIVV